MNKLVTLCWNCRALYKEHYDVETYITKKPESNKCESCGKKYDLLLCRIKNKEDADGT